MAARRLNRDAVEHPNVTARQCRRQPGQHPQQSTVEALHQLRREPTRRGFERTNRRSLPDVRHRPDKKFSSTAPACEQGAF